MATIHIIGGGLGGPEAAWQIVRGAHRITLALLLRQYQPDPNWTRIN
jgi:folate-dependent tRNA-U54 methylase TrmFO/GidA